MTIKSRRLAADEAVLRLVDFINTNLAECSSPRGIDAALRPGIPRFIDFMGMPVPEYVQRRRAERALQAIMKDPTIAFERIASELGLGNARRLSKLFLRIVGISPSDYRAAVLSSHTSPSGRFAG